MPTLWFYLVTEKVSVGLCVWDRICKGDAMMEDVCVHVNVSVFVLTVCLGVLCI